MKKRIFILYLVIVLASSFLSINKVYAEGIRVDAVSAIAIDAESGLVLFDQSGHKVIPMASTTKIITCLIALQSGNLDEEFEISKNAASIRGSKVGYKAGEKVTLRELLYGLMLRSGNDCAIAIAEGISGSVEEFCKTMNEFGLSIGLLDSHFESPHGLDSASHYSSAYDLAIATKKAKEVDEFNKIVSTKLIGEEENVKFSREFNNINKLLYQEPNCTGVKTGYTGQAGKCLVSSFKIGSNEIIVVTLNCTPRWRESQKIYEYVKDNYDYDTVLKSGDVIGTITIRGKNVTIPLVVGEDLILPVKKGEEIKKRIIIPNYDVDPPIHKEDSIGSIILSNSLGSKYTVMLHPQNNVSKLNIFEKVRQFISNS